VCVHTPIAPLRIRLSERLERLDDGRALVAFDAAASGRSASPEASLIRSGVRERASRSGSVSFVGKKILVVSTVEHADVALRAYVGDAETIKVVVPVVRQGPLDWLANDEKAVGHAGRVAERTADELSGETVSATAGEANVDLAIRDALATFPADEVVVAVRPHEQEGVLESHATDSAPQQSIDGVPVRYVVIDE
jgi:hypothetical protein